MMRDGNLFLSVAVPATGGTPACSSIGSAALAARPDHLRECRDVVRAFGADEISDHFAYSWVDGRRLNDFAPLWRVQEQLDLVVENVARVQDAVGVPLARGRR